MISEQPLWAAVAVLAGFFLVLAFVVHKASVAAPKMLAKVLLALAVVIGAVPALLYALAAFKS